MHDHADHSHADHGSADTGHEAAVPREGYRRAVDRAWANAGEATNLAEQMVSPTLRGRESKCSAGCGSDGNCGSGGCGTGGCGVGSLVDLVVRDYVYEDDRRVIEVQYKGARREFVVVPDPELPLRVNDLELVDSERGTDAGFVSMTGSLVHAKRKAKQLGGEPLSALLRKASVQDAERHNRNRASELEAMRVCRARIEAFALPMKLVDAEWQFDHHRITFYFTAEGRVDFRELVRDLASIFRTRIELRQIAVRDEAKRIGGVGICGRELCCTTHLGRYEHITLDHAKTQSLQLNPTKLSGQCGRLKCCLLYELDSYVNGLKRFPPLESTVRTAKGEGRVQKIDIFRDIIFLHHAATDEWESMTLVELHELRSGARAVAEPVAGERSAAGGADRSRQRGNDARQHGGRPKESRRTDEPGKQRERHASAGAAPAGGSRAEGSTDVPHDSASGEGRGNTPGGDSAGNAAGTGDAHRADTNQSPTEP